MFLAKRQGPPPPLQHPGLPGGLDVPDLWARSGLPAVLSGIVGPELELPGLEPFRRPRWSFETFEHPLACQFREALARSGVRGLLDRAQQEAVARGKSFQDLYRPTWLSTPSPRAMSTSPSTAPTRPTTGSCSSTSRSSSRHS